MSKRLLSRATRPVTRNELIFKQHIQETSLTERKTGDILQKETLA